MKNILKDCDIKSFPLINFNISDNLTYYLWHNLFFENKILLDIDLLNALIDNINGNYKTTY